MAYLYDIRERSIAAVKQGSSNQAVFDMFGIDRKTLYNLLRKVDLGTNYRSVRTRIMDKAALAAHVRDYPDALLRERAAHFGVSVHSVWVALWTLRMTKKNDSLSGK
jgi:transposase